MKTITQTIVGIQGNCMAACIASVLEIPIEAVPNYGHLEDWIDRFNDWIADANLRLLNFRLNGQTVPKGYLIRALETDHETLHAVVYRDGLEVWDPHPIPIRFTSYRDDWTAFVILDPASPVNAKRLIPGQLLAEMAESALPLHHPAPVVEQLALEERCG